MIGKLKKVSLREVWKNEAYDFTSWLSKNLDLLGDALDMSFNEDESEDEKKLEGSFLHVDIYTTTEDEKGVVIENQLEQTDHKHLGQILTYMENMNADIAIWIAKKPRQEHIEVINWLNEATEKDFYLIQLEAYSVDKSHPAPFFNVICKPSFEAKKIGERKKEMSERGKLRVEFWQSLIETASEKTDIFSNLIPYPSTIRYVKRRNGTTLICFVQKHTSAISLYFPKRHKDYFLRAKKDIEKELGYSIEIEEFGNRNRHRLIKRLESGGYQDKEKWNQVQNDMVDHMIEFEKVLSPYVDGLTKRKVA